MRKIFENFVFALKNEPTDGITTVEERQRKVLDKLKSLFTGKSTSPGLKLDLTDFKKLLRTGVFVGGAAGVTYILANIGAVDFDGKDSETGINAIIVTVLTIVFEGVARFFRDNTEEKADEKKE